MVYRPYRFTKLSNSKPRNYRNLNGIDYRFKKIDPNFDGSKGSNSSVFFIVNAQNDVEEYAIKIANIPKNAKGSFHEARNLRFEREIEALYLAKTKKLNNIIEIIEDGTIVMPDNRGSEYELRYYIMEKGNGDLKEYVLSDISLDVQEKIEICIDLSSAIDQLNQIGIYHRDIKPDNIFNIDGIWKVGDLGLFDYRDQDKNIDKVNERIGPFGWHSPEAMNKHLTEERDSEFDYDCMIDHQSDIYQLGMIFWFIFQGNAPIGQVQNTDFLYKFHRRDVMYDLIQLSLSYGKQNRPENLELVIKQLFEIGEEFGLS